MNSFLPLYKSDRLPDQRMDRVDEAPAEFQCRGFSVLGICKFTIRYSLNISRKNQSFQSKNFEMRSFSCLFGRGTAKAFLRVRRLHEMLQLGYSHGQQHLDHVARIFDVQNLFTAQSTTQTRTKHRPPLVLVRTCATRHTRHTRHNTYMTKCSLDHVTGVTGVTGVTNLADLSHFCDRAFPRPLLQLRAERRVNRSLRYISLNPSKISQWESTHMVRLWNSLQFLAFRLLPSPLASSKSHEKIANSE